MKTITQIILDILHSYLGLAALATMRDPELRSIDPTLCISMRAKENFEARETVDETESLSFTW